MPTTIFPKECPHCGLAGTWWNDANETLCSGCGKAWLSPMGSITTSCTGCPDLTRAEVRVARLEAAAGKPDISICMASPKACKACDHEVGCIWRPGK